MEDYETAGESSPILEIKFVPYIYIAASAVMLFLFLGFMVIPFTDVMGEDLTLPMWLVGEIFLLFSVWAAISIARDRYGYLRIADSIYYRLPLRDLHFKFPLENAVRIDIVARLSQVDNTRYLLVINTGGKNEHGLFFAEHRLSGRSAMKKARAVADILGIPISDPFREENKDSWEPVTRWLARGEEWKLFVAVAVILIGGLYLLGAFG